jgi:hypothetical protein
MASTFSPTLRIELIGDGDQSGIWGQTTNTNLGTLLEQAITGVVSITMTNADYTLSNFNGVSDESRNAVLVVGGTNAAVRDVIAPLVEKLYVVKNSTSGGFAINIRAATGSSVSVPSGATVWVYCDGTNFNAINTESVGNFEVNGNLTVTGNTNAVAATYTGNVAALNISTANVTATGAGSFTGNVSAANFTGAGLTITSINASNISAGTIANARTTAASANGASTIVARDSNGSFSANVGTFVTVSGTYSGNGAGLTDINASNISSGTISNARTTAASANGASTIVARDANGSFAANVVTATTGTFTSISGNGVALTAINASNISSGTIANARTTADSANGASTIVARDSSGNFTANAITTTSISGNGVALTAINASNISSGTVASARITGSYTGITGVGTLTAGTWNATTIAVANGGTGVTSSTGTGSVVLSASPTFTGTPLSTTAANGTNTTQIATTAFVNSAVTIATGSLGTISTQNANNVNITGGSITGITDLAVADGGTGASTFTANSVVLGNGTSSLAGNMIAPGTSGNVLTSNGSTWTSASTQSVGVGQTWQAVTRTAGTPYTNSTGKPISFFMSFAGSSSGTESIILTIDGVAINFIYGILVSGVAFGQNSIVIPTGATYSYTQLTGLAKNIFELR